MTISLFIISLSITLQLLSVFVALRLMAFRGKRAVGALMLLAASLMSFRRFISLQGMIAGSEIKTDLFAEFEGCIVSFILLAGFLYLSRLIASHQREMNERKRAAETIELLNHHNEMVLKSAGEGICGIDLDGAITFANPAATRLTGWSVDELIGKSQHEFLHHSRPDGTPHPREECKIYAPLRDGIVRRIADEVFRRKDGTNFPVEYVSTPIQEGGRIVGAVVVFNDISERIFIEDALRAMTRREREEKAKTEAIIAAIGDGISIHDTNYKILYQNKVAQGFYGMRVGEHCYKAYQNREQVCERCHLTMAFADGMIHKREQKRTTDRGVFYYEITASPLRDASGNIVAGIELIREITERKAAEEVLRSNEERLSRAQQIAHVGDWQWDIATNRVTWSDELYRIYGYKPHEIAPHHELVVNALHPKSKDEFDDNVNAALKGERSFEMDYVFFRRDGSVAVLHTIGQVMRNNEGTPVRMVGVVQDITERKQAEESLLLFRNLLNHTEDAIFVNDPATGRFLMVNNRTCSNLGYGSDTLLLMKTLDIEATFPDQASWDAHVNEVRSKGNMILEGVHKRHDGTAYPVEVNVTYMTVGEKDYMVAVARDITERKLSEQALRLSEERLSRAQKMAHVGNWVKNLVTDELYWSEEVYRIYGVDPVQFTPTSEAFKKAMHPDDLEPFIKALNAALYERKHLDRDYRIIRPDGTIRTIHTIGEVTYDPAGKPLSHSGTVQDVTERRQVAEALRRSEAMLQAIIDTEPECVKLLDAEARLIMMNRAGLEMIEVDSLEQVKGQCISPMVTSEYRGPFMELTRNIFQGQSGTLLFEIVGAKGTRRWLETHAVPFRNEKDEIVALLGITRDVTDRKRAEEALKKTNTQLQALIHTIPDMVVFKDVAGRHVIVNRAVEEITGHSKDEITGKTIEDILPPALAAACRKSDEEAMQRSVPTHAQERVVREDGRETYFDMVKAPMVDPEGNVIGMVAIGRDITERRAAEEAIRESEQRYRSLVDLATDGILLLSPQQDGVPIIVDVNTAACMMNGYARAELIGKPITFLERSEKEGDISAIVERIKEDNTTFERNHVRKDGSVFPVEVSSRLVHIGGKPFILAIDRNITERKKVEEALNAAVLKANAEKVKTEAVISAIGDFMIILDPEFKIIYQNKVAVDSIGDHVGETCYKAFENKGVACEGCPVETSFRDGLVHRGERTAASVIGTMHLDITASPLKDVSGKVTAVIEMVKDVTERRRAEALVRESQEKYKNLVELSADIIYLSDKDGNQVFMNDQAFKTLEYSPEDVIGRPWSFLIHPDDKGTSAAVFTAMIEQEVDIFNFENRYVTKSGSVINVLHNVRILRNEKGEIVGTQGIARDITQRKQVEDRLKLFSRAMEEATDGVQIVELEGRIVYSNKALEEMYGYSSGELTGKHVNEMSVEQEFSSRVIIPEMMQTGSWNGEIMNVRKDGSRFPIWLSTALVKNDKGEPIAMIGIIRDITERRRAETALRKSHVELEVLVHERTAELRMINEQLSKFSSYLQEAREKERTAIAREIHDELGQALTALKMDLSWLKKRLPKNQKPLLEKEASMSELVEATIQTVKKISTELRPGILDHLGLTAAIEWQAEEFQKRTGIPCGVSIVPEEIVPDKDRSTTIFRIFQETLTNITRHAKATKVSIRLEKEDNSLILEVRDNGKGITEKQLSDSKSLGLMGIRERAAYWGGHVNMKGVRNSGTTVIVQIPLDRTGGVA